MSGRRKFDTLVARAWDIFHKTEDAGYGVVVRPSIPILFFGDSAAYFASAVKVITVGLNPSKREFDGSDPFHRFPRARNVGDTSLDEYIESLNEYFKTDPCDWFNCYEPMLKGMGVSYYPGANGVALHTDICSPVATAPTWNKLAPAIKQTLFKNGRDLWHDLVRALDPDVVVVSVAKKYATGIQFPRLGDPRVLFTIDRTNPYVVMCEEIEVTSNRRSKLVKGNAAQTPFGKVSNDDKRRIGQLLRESLDA